MDGLTELEAAMLSRLHDCGVISWLDVQASETRTLNRLVRKKLALKGGENSPYPRWYPLAERVEVGRDK